MIESKNNPPWFEEWFDTELYPQVYRHRSDKEAHSTIDMFMNSVPLAPGAKVLDLCCGSGRHARALHNAGFDVTGIDLSGTLLDIARRESEADGPDYFRRDMRDTYPGAPYDCVTNFFTSFGYFDDEEDDIVVLRRVVEALRKPGGCFFFDYLNAEFTRSNLIPSETKTFEDMTVVLERSVDHKFVYKTITIAEGGRENRFVERVRLYDLGDFERMFYNAGLSIRNIFGSYDGGAYSQYAPRLIIVAHVE